MIEQVQPPNMLGSVNAGPNMHGSVNAGPNGLGSVPIQAERTVSADPSRMRSSVPNNGNTNSGSLGCKFGSKRNRTWRSEWNGGSFEPNRSSCIQLQDQPI